MVRFFPLFSKRLRSLCVVSLVPSLGFLCARRLPRPCRALRGSCGRSTRDSRGRRRFCVSVEEGEYAALEFFRIKAESGGVVNTGHFPELPGGARPAVNHLRVVARQSFILFITDEKNWKKGGGPRFHRGDFL